MPHKTKTVKTKAHMSCGAHIDILFRTTGVKSTLGNDITESALNCLVTMKRYQFCRPNLLKLLHDFPTESLDVMSMSVSNFSMKESECWTSDYPESIQTSLSKVLQKKGQYILNSEVSRLFPHKYVCIWSGREVWDKASLWRKNYIVLLLQIIR